MDAMIHNMDPRQKIVFLITLVGGSLDFAKIDIGDYKEVAESDQSDVDKTSKLDMFSWALTSWYRDMKQTAYMEIMADNSGSGGIYLFDKDFDPLNLQTKFAGKI